MVWSRCYLILHHRIVRRVIRVSFFPASRIWKTVWSRIAPVRTRLRPAEFRNLNEPAYEITFETFKIKNIASTTIIGPSTGPARDSRSPEYAPSAPGEGGGWIRIARREQISETAEDGVESTAIGPLAGPTALRVCGGGARALSKHLETDNSSTGPERNAVTGTRPEGVEIRIELRPVPTARRRPDLSPRP